MSKKLNTILVLSLVFFIQACSDCKTEKNCKSENNTLSTIMGRKSVRKYLDKSVESEKIDIMLKAAMAAPTGKNKQPWEFVIVSDKEILNKMGEGLPYAKMLKEVNQALIVCGDTTKSNYWYLDCSLASQNFLLAAEALGLGAVWTAVFPYDDRISVVNDALDLPEHIIPLNIIPFGYPAGSENAKDKFDPTKIHSNRF